MIRNILILSSDFTGHGHKSIATSLIEQFTQHYPNVKVHVIDGFTLGGSMSERIGKSYGPLTRRSKELWKLIWDITCKKPSIVHELTQAIIEDNFLKLLSDIKPDVIVSVHPSFISSVINILEDYKLKLPFITVIADLVSISPLWADPRADYTLAPTQEAKERCMDFGVPESKIRITGFPVREKFSKHIANSANEKDYTGDRPFECLLMSGGEGSGNMSRIANILLKNFNCRIKVITGRNALLKKRLETTLRENYAGRADIHGFVENVQDVMLTCDIAITRGSPNVMMEAVMCNVPVVVTGALPGQEEGNPGFMEKNHLGVVCNDLSNLKDIVKGLIVDNAAGLNRIKQAQRVFRNPNAAKNIADVVMETETFESVQFPPAPNKKFPARKVKQFITEKIRYRQKT